MKQQYSIKSLSPAYWFACDEKLAASQRGRGQVSPSFGSKAEVERWIARQNAIAALIATA